MLIHGTAMDGAGSRGNGEHQGSFNNQAQGGFPSGNFMAGRVGGPSFQATGGAGFQGNFQGAGNAQFQQVQGWSSGPGGSGGGVFQGGQQWMAPGNGFPQQQQGFGAMQQQGFIQGSTSVGAHVHHPQAFHQDSGPGTGHGGSGRYGTGRGFPRQRERGRDRGRGRNSLGRGYGGRGAATTPHGGQFQAPQDIAGQQHLGGANTVGRGMEVQVNNNAQWQQHQRVAGQVVTGRHGMPTDAPAPTATHQPSGSVNILTGIQPEPTSQQPEFQRREGKEVDVDANSENKLSGEKRKKKKGKGKPEDAWCFKCCSKGHVTAECSTILFCNICESDEHVAARCPLKKKPRPVAVAVGYAVDDLGFYHIPFGPIPVSKVESNTALIKVEGGSLTEEELIGHLKRLFSGKFDWDVQLHASNAWRAPFPSKVDYTRAINFGSADLKNGTQLIFEKFEEEEEYFGHELPTIWMRTVNLPRVLRTYEVLWAIGNMFGATVKVDMVTTRKSNFGRFKVAVLNPNLVPNKMDCVIGTRFFELRFAIEPFGTDNGAAENKKKEEEDDGDDNPNHNADTEMEEANKKPKMDSSSSKSLNKHNDPSGEQQRDGSLEDFDEDDLLDDLGDGSVPVMTAEMILGGNEGSDAPLDLDDGVTHLAAGTQDMAGIGANDDQVVTGTHVELTHPSPALGPLLERALAGLKEAQHVEQARGGDSTGLMEDGFVTPQATWAFDDIATPLRRSKRREASVDEDSIERAARLVAKKNLEVDEGYLQRDTLAPVLVLTAQGGRATTSHIGVPCT